MKRIVLDIIRAHKKALLQFEQSGIDTVIQIAVIINESLNRGGCLYLCGNGGSAGDCQHIAGEFVGRFKNERKPLPAIAFSTDTSVITCIGNDYGYEDIFTRQVEALVGADDVLWAFSTSGSSPNVVAAAKLAKDKGAQVVAFTGRAKSELENIADICLCADAPQTSTAQEIHELAYHIICDIVERNLNI